MPGGVVSVRTLQSSVSYLSALSVPSFTLAPLLSNGGWNQFHGTNLVGGDRMPSPSVSDE